MIFSEALRLFVPEQVGIPTALVAATLEVPSLSAEASQIDLLMLASLRWLASQGFNPVTVFELWRMLALEAIGGPGSTTGWLKESPGKAPELRISVYDRRAVGMTGCGCRDLSTWATINTPDNAGVVSVFRPYYAIQVDQSSAPANPNGK